MKVVIIGANGQLGSDIHKAFSPKHDVTGLNHEDLEIVDFDRCQSVLGSVKPDLVINTAAYHNVPKCEEHPSRSFEVNALGAFNLAKLANIYGFDVAHFSTDYVFDGAKGSPYLEDDLPNPLNVYGNTKLAGEYFLKAYCDRHYVIRVSGLYGSTVCRAKGTNFVSTMKRLAAEKPTVTVVNDEVLSPTSAGAIAQNTLQLVESRAYGVYHMTCEGSCSWYEFAQVIFATLGLNTPLLPRSMKDHPSLVRRPSYSVLDNAALKRLGMNAMPNWRDALVSFLRDYHL